MTQAFNLAQLANNINTSGQLDATDGLSGLVANTNLASSGTASSTTFLSGDRTWQTISQKLLNYTVLTDSTRVAVSLSPSSTARVVQFSKSYTKLSSTSKLLFQINLIGKNAGAGAIQMVCQYGSSAEGISVNYNYVGTWMQTAQGFYLLTGYTTTGAQNFTVSNYAANAQSGNGWTNVMNPNSSDDNRLNQTESSVTVWELE